MGRWALWLWGWAGDEPYGGPKGSEHGLEDLALMVPMDGRRGHKVEEETGLGG